MNNKPFLVLFCLIALIIQGCTTSYAEPERPQVLEDRDEAKLIMRYLHNDILNYALMKQVFYDLYLIRSLYGEKLPFLMGSKLVGSDYQRRVPLWARGLTDKCYIYPRKIRDGISYLFQRTYYTASEKKLIEYHYFECKFDKAEYIGVLEQNNPLIPGWWIDAEKNLISYETR